MSSRTQSSLDNDYINKIIIYNAALASLDHSFDLTLVTYSGYDTKIEKGAVYDAESDRLIVDTSNYTF